MRKKEGANRDDSHLLKSSDWRETKLSSELTSSRLLLLERLERRPSDRLGGEQGGRR